MKERLLRYLACPECSGGLQLKNVVKDGPEIKEGLLYCACGSSFIIKDYIPRFVDSDGYLSSFSFEWKIHSRTQLDSANKGKAMEGVSERNFSKRVDFPLVDLKGKMVLDAGCGMGRFSEIAAKYGAEVIGLDLSQAVDVAMKNVGFQDSVHLIQADIFKLPLRQDMFDFIFSFGVLHHTPDCARAFGMLPKLLKKNGKISIFVYSSYNKGIVYISGFWRFFTTRLPRRILYLVSYISVPLYYFYKIPILGSIAKLLFVIPMWPDWRWRVLDTFDWYSPKYQSKHTYPEVFGWFRQAGLRQLMLYEPPVAVRGTRDSQVTLGPSEVPGSGH